MMFLLQLLPNQVTASRIATRVAAVWFSLMIDEAHGDLDLAVRAYNRGIASARAGAGGAYRDVVQQRLNRFVRNQGAPAAWNYLWWKAATRK